MTPPTQGSTSGPQSAPGAVAATTPQPGAKPPPSPSSPASASPLNPAPTEFPKTETGLEGPAFDALMSRVAALRSRIAQLSTLMFSSKLRIELRARGESVRIETLRVSLDGGVVYTAPKQNVFEQPEIVYEHAVAAGAHVVAIEVERRDLRQPQYSTWQASRFVVVVPEQRLLWTRLELEGASSMGDDFAEDQAGQYELGVRLLAEVSE
jgi:hypothetical protein